MAKDVITRFKLETTAYDSKLRDAAKGLADYSKTATAAGKEFGKFTQSNVEAARALGNIAPSANNAKDKVKELVGAFNEASKAYNHLTKEQQQSDFGKAMAESLSKLKVQIAEAKKELYGLSDSTKGVGSGLFSGDKMSGMLQVFGGNVMTKLAGVGVGFVSEIKDMVAQGAELAKQGEGIRIAFERLGRGDILDGLREATHGTVTDLELMKAAVKFNDFKLPVEELGTMLAFAQQKAKDTGQSVDYMVDSIVTGLGRKSLMILDNLGLSASEIKERMAETGDMTKAVGAIIREQMAKAGDYVETAADRATQANVSLQNKMEELGRKFAPLEEASNNFWTSMKIGILDVVGGPLARLLNGLTEAGRMMNAYGKMGGSGKVGRMTSILAGASEQNRQSIYQQQQEQFWRYINPREQQIKDIRAWQSGQRGETLQGRIGAITEKYGSLDATKIQAEVDAAKKMLADYQSAAKQILHPTKQEITPTITTSGGTRRSSSPSRQQTEMQKNQAEIAKLAQEYVRLGDSETEASRQRQAEIQKEIQLLEKRNGLLGLYQEQAQGRLMGIDVMTDGLSRTGGFTGLATPQSMSDVVRERGGNLLDDKAMKALNEDISRNLPKAKEKDSPLESGKKLLDGISQLTDGLEKIGIDIPDEIQSVISTIQGVMQVIEAVSTIISVGQESALTANTVAMGVLSEALWANTATSWLPFANGGVVHAAGGIVAGNTFSGDQIPAMLNAGEVVLNRAQAGNLASQLEGGAAQNLKLDAVISGEQIRLVLNNNGRRTGRGEYVQSTRRRG